MRHRRNRDRHRRFVLERVGAFVRAVEADVPILGIVTSPVLLTSSVARAAVDLCRQRGVPIEEVDPTRFRALKQARRASGIAAIVRSRWTPLHRAAPDRGLGWLAVEHIRSPGNLGTILRTAEAAGAAGLICLGDSVDPHDPAVVRSSMGAVPLLSLVRTRPQTLFRWARTHQVAIVAADPAAPERWDTAPLPDRRILLLGEERQGLTPELLAGSTHRVRLPQTGRADSLNVAVAAGVLLYELVRRAPHDRP